MEKMEYGFVTEVGVFGNLDIDDPTVIEAKKKKQEELDALIESATAENLETLTAINE